MCQKLCSARNMCCVMLAALAIGLLGLSLSGCTPAEPTPPASVSSEPPDSASGLPDSGWGPAQPAETGLAGSQETPEVGAAGSAEAGSGGAVEAGTAQATEASTAAAGEAGTAGTTESGAGQLAMGSTRASLPPDVELVPIPLELPPPAFKGTPVPLDEPNVEKPRGAQREQFLAQAGTYNVARGMPVVCSDPAPASGEVDFVTDGAKEASDFGYLELHPGVQWVQIDLGRRTTIYAVLIWHNHAEAVVYRDVIVQISDDPDFLTALTVFNNDYDNSAGLGIGQDLGYVETAEGKLIDCGGVEGRYVRLYSNGNHIDGKNHYTEVEVFGRPAE